MSTSYEGGLRPGRLWYLRESTTGTTDNDPSWNLYSDNVRSVDPSFDPGVEGQEGLGTADFLNHFAGVEASGLTVEYDLQEKSASGETLISGGSPNDAVADAFDRDSDNRIQNTHSVVRRIEQSDLEAANTVNGSTSLDTRQYIVGKGGYPNATLTNDPDSPQPVLATVEYEFEKLRMYQIDQPSASTQLRVYSTDSADTSVTVTIEDEGASTTEDVTTDGSDGTTATTSTESFDNIDVIELGSETAGDIQVYVNDSGSDGDQLAVIRGQDSYDHGEGDLGVPALGGGSTPGAIGQSYELAHDDSVERPSGTGIADVINTTEFSVDNNYDGVGQLGTPRRALSANGRDAQATGTLAGETERVNYVDELFRTTATNLVWTLSGGALQLDNATVVEASGSTEARQGRMALDVTLEGEGVTLS